jgi:hypothetical protein
MTRRSFFAGVLGAMAAPFVGVRKAISPVRLNLDSPVRWRNYTSVYTNVSKAEFIAKLTRAMNQRGQ